jgi:hypothetical protein
MWTSSQLSAWPASSDGFFVVLKDISRDIFVGLHYTVMKPQSQLPAISHAADSSGLFCYVS